MASVANIVRFVPAAGGTADFVYSAAVTGYRSPTSSPALVNGDVYRYRAESSNLGEWEVGEGTWTTGSTTLARTTIIHSSTGAKVNFTAAPDVAVVALADQFINPAGDTMIGSLVVPNASGLKIKDTDASHTLGIVGGSNLTADRTLTVTTGDADRALTLTADASVGGTNTGDQNLFSTIAVSGQSNVVADAAADTLTLAAGANITITTNASTDTITIAGAAGGTAAATQAEMEAASSTSVATSPGRQHNHPGHLKAGISFYYTLSTHSTVSSVNTTTDEITTAAAHTLTTGDAVMCSTTGPTGWGSWVFYFARVTGSTTFTLHATYADAQNNTNKIDLTAAGSSTRTIYRFDVTVLWSWGGATTAAITPKPGVGWTFTSATTNGGPMRFTFATALSATASAIALATSWTFSIDTYAGPPMLFPTGVTTTTYSDWDIRQQYTSGGAYAVSIPGYTGSSFPQTILIYGDQ